MVAVPDPGNRPQGQMGYQPPPCVVPELRRTYAYDADSIIVRASDVGRLDLPEMPMSDGKVGAQDFRRPKQQEGRPVERCTGPLGCGTACKGTARLLVDRDFEHGMRAKDLEGTRHDDDSAMPQLTIDEMLTDPIKAAGAKPD